MNMHYYEIWFYFYGEEDERTDFEKEFTFYVKTENVISSDNEMIEHLRNTFSPSEKYNVDQINCVDPKHYPFMTRWFEIDAQEFTNSCGISA